MGALETDAAALVQAAFKRINAGEYSAARPMVERALALKPHTGAVAHARAHLDTESKETAAGAAFLRTFLAEHDPFDGINVHNAWHLAALEFDLGRHDAALEWYERVVGPSVAEYPVTLYAAASLLWRVYVADGERALPWEPLRTVALEIEKAIGVEHLGSAIAFITTGDEASLERLLGRLRAADPGDPAAGTPEVLLPVIEGFREFWDGEYGAAVAHFKPVASHVERLSQFPEHRTPVEETYRAARERAGSTGERAR